MSETDFLWGHSSVSRATDLHSVGRERASRWFHHECVFGVRAANESEVQASKQCSSAAVAFESTAVWSTASMEEAG